MASINKENTIGVKELLGLIPDEQLVEFSKMTGVDYQVKKLYGRYVFYLLLYGLLESNRTSLRSLQEIYNSPPFKFVLRNCHCSETKFNSISSRLATMEPEYFKKTYHFVYETFSKLYSETDALQYKITKVDSSMVRETANKLQQGLISYNQYRKERKQIKYTVCLTDLLPSSFEIFTEQTHHCEDYTIPQAILNSVVKDKDNVFVFDRGVNDRSKYDEFTKENLRFVTRIRIDSKIVVVQSNCLTMPVVHGNLRVVSDEQIRLVGKGNKETESVFRLIKAYNPDKKKDYFFISNDIDLDYKAIIDIYKRRWNIEVFFRFLKQELNLKHFFSTHLNGIRIIMLMTMIASMLVLIYKKLNGLGFKIAKIRFVYELQALFTAIIVVHAGGDPNLVFRET